MQENNSEQYVEMAYARVSTKAQSLERQKASIYEVIPDLKAMYYFEDTYTGKAFDRPDYLKLKEKINPVLEILLIPAMAENPLLIIYIY